MIWRSRARAFSFPSSVMPWSFSMPLKYSSKLVSCRTGIRSRDSAGNSFSWFLRSCTVFETGVAVSIIILASPVFLSMKSASAAYAIVFV